MGVVSVSLHIDSYRVFFFFFFFFFGVVKINQGNC